MTLFHHRSCHVLFIITNVFFLNREIESTSRQRRQSAPPPIAHSLSSPNQDRDEAYMRAITKFNEWRNIQRFEKLNETNNHSAITQIPNELSIMTNDVSISDIEIDESEKRKLLEMHRQRKAEDANRRLDHKTTLYGSAMTRSHRLSLPIMKESSSDKSQRRRSRKTKIHPSTTIDEIEEFEQNHCRQLEEDYSFSVTSPPSKFYRDNSDPFTKQPTPKRQSLMGRGMLRRARSHGKGKAPQPPMVDSEASSGFQNGNYKHYDVTSPSVYSEFLTASNNYKANVRKHQPEKINSVGESASSGSLSSDPEKNAKTQRRLSPPYQTVINKHGDEVEYALPYNERDSVVNLPALPITQPPQLTPSKFDQIINENFEFLHSHLEFFNAEADEMLNQQIDAAFEPIIDASFSDLRRRDAQVTDLDKSNDTGLGTPAQSGDIFRELDALSKWANNLEKCEEEKSPVEEYQAMHGNVKVFKCKDIKYKSGILRNSFSTPLEFSTGYFHATPVTMRSTLPNIYGINSFADVASKREFEILR
jgi:hypothetical protein